MTRIVERMREELVRRNYAESTMRSYLGTVEDFRQYFQKRLDHLELANIRRYQVHMREERKLGRRHCYQRNEPAKKAKRAEKTAWERASTSRSKLPLSATSKFTGY